jgi:hypothetical protein
MTPPIFTLLAAAPAVTALVGVSPVRIFPGGIAPEGTVLPYATWQIVSLQPENYLADRPDMEQTRVQLDCWGATQAQAMQLYNAAIAALELDAYQVSFNDDSQDAETLNWRQSADFEFWVDR